MIRLLLYAAAVALASASTAMIHDTTGSGNPTLSAMFGKDFCFVEDHVWTPTVEDMHVILYDSCILRITVDMTGKIGEPKAGSRLGDEKDGCTVRYHPDGQGHGWVYRGAMKWEAVLIPYKNAVHVSVIGHRDNACTLEFMPTSGEPMECPQDMCPKRFFPIAQGTTGKNDKRCCEECTAGVCHQGFRLKESLDRHFNKEDECCEKLKVAFKAVKECEADEYRRDISETANGTFCKKCPTPCPRGQEPNLKKAKKQKVDECCVACEKCEENQYAADDGTTCCKTCACGGGTFVNTDIKAKSSEKQCCQACPATCPSGQTPSTEKITSLGDCCKECPKCSSEGKEYVTGDGECCKACVCEAGQYFKTMPAANKDACCGACAGVTCKTGQKKKTPGTGPFDSEEECCEVIKIVCAGAKCDSYFYNDEEATDGQCCKACNIKDCGTWRTLNPAPKKNEDCCEPLTTAEFCAADQFACPSSMYPMYPKHSEVPEAKKETLPEIIVTGGPEVKTSMATHKNTSSLGGGATKMTAEVEAAKKQNFCCQACTCEANQVKKPFPTESTECCEACGTCSPRQYTVTKKGGHGDQKSCCAACNCEKGQYFKQPTGVAASENECCGACPETCPDGEKRTGKSEARAVDSEGECCEAKTWSEYCTKDKCPKTHVLKTTIPTGNVGIENEEKKEENKQQIEGLLDFKSSIFENDPNNLVEYAKGKCCEVIETYCEQENCGQSQFKSPRKVHDKAECCEACPKTCPSGKTRTKASEEGAVDSMDKCCEGIETYCGKEGNCGKSQFKSPRMVDKEVKCCEDCVKCEKWQKTESKEGGFTSKDQCCTDQEAKEYCGEVKCEGKVKHIKEQSLQDQMTALSIDDSSLPQEICCMKASDYCKDPAVHGSTGCTTTSYFIQRDHVISDGKVDKCCEACKCDLEWQKKSEQPGPFTSQDQCCEAKTCADAEVACETQTSPKTEEGGQTVLVPKVKQDGFTEKRVSKPNDPNCCKENPLAKDPNFKYVNKQWTLTDFAVQAIQFETCGISSSIEKKSIMICSRTGEKDLYPLDAAGTYQNKKPKKVPKKALEEYLKERAEENQYSRLKPTGVGKIKELAEALQKHGLTVKSAEIQGPFLATTQDNSLNSKYYWGLGAARAAIVALELKERLESAGEKKVLQKVYEAAKGCRGVFQPDSGKKPKSIKSTSITPESSASQDECPKGNEEEKECCEYTRRDNGFKEVGTGTYDKDNNEVMEKVKTPIEVVMEFTLEDAEKK